MNKAFEQLKSQTITLSLQERAELVEFLLDSLDPFDQEIKKAWHLEMKRRLSEIKNGDANNRYPIGRPAEEVLADLRSRFP